MDLELLENLQEKNPKIIAEYFFENFEYNEIGKLVKQIQKKIMEKNNSLKLMLSHRYVDLLDCSELIENLKHYSNRMNEIAERNAENIKNSLDFISEKKTAPVKAAQPKKINDIDRYLLLQRKALEMANRDIQFNSIAEKIYFIVLFLINTSSVTQSLSSNPQDDYKKREYIQNEHQLRDILTELFARMLSSLGQIVASIYTYDRKEVLISILGIIRGVQYMTSHKDLKPYLEEIIEDILPNNGEGQENLPGGEDIKGVLEFSFTLLKRILEIRLEKSRETPAKTLKYFLKVIKDLLWMLCEESDGYVIRKVDEAVQATIFNSPVFRALIAEGNHGIEKMSVILEPDFAFVIEKISHSTKEFVQSITPKIEALIRNNSKINSKFNAEFLSQVLWEGEQKELLQGIKTKYGLELPQRIEEVFRSEWKSYSEYYMKQIIQDFSIEESFSHIMKSISPYVLKQEDSHHSKVMNMEKVNKRLKEAVDIADTHWKKSISEYEEFWGTFDKNMFQSLAELEHLEEIIADSLQKKVVAINNEFSQMFFENQEIKPQKKYVLIVILVNYLELTYQTLSKIMKDLKKKGLFEKLLKSLCDRIYQTIENDISQQISAYIGFEKVGEESTQDSGKTHRNKRSLKLLAKINKKLLQFQVENIDHPKYIVRFKESIKSTAQKLVGPEQDFSPDSKSILRSLAHSSFSDPSTHPMNFFYFMENPELERVMKSTVHHGDHLAKKKEKVINIRDTLFLEKLSVEQNEFLNDYTIIPVQKFTLKKKVESMVPKKEKKAEGTETSTKIGEEINTKLNQFGITADNIDNITEKAKNIMGGMFKLLKK